MLESAVIAQLLCFGIAVLLVQRTDPASARVYHPTIFLGAIYLAYSLGPLFLPERVLLVRSLARFEVVQLTGMLGIVMGLAFARIRSLSSPALRLRETGAVVRKPTTVRSWVVVLAVVVLFLLAIGRYLGGIEKILMEGYGTGTVETELDTLALSAAYLMPVGVLGAVLLVEGASAPFWVGAGVFFSVNLLAGQRNVVLMLLSVIISYSALRRGRANYVRVVLVCIIGFVVFMLTGVYRQYGMRGLTAFVEVLRSGGVALLNPSGQELNTAFNVWSLYDSAADRAFDAWARGRSYFFAVVGFVPRLIWPGRPISIANEFSNRFAERAEGLGFSPNVEALINFGQLGPMLVGTAISYLLTRIYERGAVYGRSPIALCVYGVMPFFIFNWNRIDFAVAFKMTALLAICLRVGFALLGANEEVKRASDSDSGLSAVVLKRDKL